MKIRSPKLMAAIGGVAMIGSLLVAAPNASAAPSADIVDTAVSAGSFTTLVAAVQAAGLVDTLKGPGPFTVFAPTDKAFATALRRLHVTPAQLLGNKELLTKILTYHVVSGKVLSTDLKRFQLVPTVNGRNIGVRAFRNGTVTVNRTARVISANIETTNGVIHVIDRVLIPRNAL